MSDKKPYGILYDIIECFPEGSKCRAYLDAHRQEFGDWYFTGHNDEYPITAFFMSQGIYDELEDEFPHIEDWLK